MKILIFYFALVLSALAQAPIQRNEFTVTPGLRTNHFAGRVVITATNWPGFVTNVINVQQYGAKGNGIADDTAAIQAALNAGYITTQILFPFGVYRVTSTLTNKMGSIGMRLTGMLPGWGAASGIGGFVIEKGSVLLWQGATNGTLFSFDSCAYPWVENIQFTSLHTNAAAKLVKLDQVMGGGTMTGWKFIDVGFITCHTNALHKFIACEVSPVSLNNCEGGQWINTYWRGFGLDWTACSNNSFGLVIGNNANALKLRVSGAGVVNYTNWLCMTNGSIDVEDVFLTYNAVDLRIIGGLDWLNFARMRSEAYRQFCVTDGIAVLGSGIKFSDIGIADTAGRNTSYPLFDIRGQANLAFNDIVGGATQPAQPFIRFINAGSEASKIYRLDNVQTATNHLREFYAAAFVAPHYNQELTPFGAGNIYNLNIKNPIAKVDASFVRGTNMVYRDTNGVQFYGENYERHVWNSSVDRGYSYNLVDGVPENGTGFVFGDRFDYYRYRLWGEGGTNNSFLDVRQPNDVNGNARVRVSNNAGTAIVQMTSAGGKYGLATFNTDLWLIPNLDPFLGLSISQSGAMRAYGPLAQVDGHLTVGTNIIAINLSSNASPVNTVGQLADGKFVKIANAVAGGSSDTNFAGIYVTNGVTHPYVPFPGTALSFGSNRVTQTITTNTTYTLANVVNGKELDAFVIVTNSATFSLPLAVNCTGGTNTFGGTNGLWRIRAVYNGVSTNADVEFLSFRPAAGTILAGDGIELIPLGVGTDGQVLTADSAQVRGVKWATPASGVGDVTAAANITDNSVVRGDGGAKGVQGSSVTIDDSGNIDTAGGVSANAIATAGNADVGGNMVALGVVEGTYLIADNNVRFTTCVALPTSQLTNYTVDVSCAENFLNATNHVNFATVAGAISGARFFVGFTITNNSGSAANLTFDPTMMPVADGYTNRIASGTAIKVTFEVNAGIVYYGVSRGGTVNNGLFTEISFTTYTPAAPTAITFPASDATWTNTTGKHIELYIDNIGITGTSIKKNGTQILGGLITGYTLMLGPGEYFSETYSIGTPSARYSQFKF